MDASQCTWQLWQTGTLLKLQKRRKQGWLQNWYTTPFWMISCLLVQFLQHMLHLVMEAAGTVCCILHLERDASESDADVDSDGGDDGATPFVAAGSSHLCTFASVLTPSVADTSVALWSSSSSTGSSLMQFSSRSVSFISTPAASSRF